MALILSMVPFCNALTMRVSAADLACMSEKLLCAQDIVDSLRLPCVIIHKVRRWKYEVTGASSEGKCVCSRREQHVR